MDGSFKDVRPRLDMGKRHLFLVGGNGSFTECGGKCLVNDYFGLRLLKKI